MNVTVPCFRCPSVLACFAFRENPFLIAFRQSNVTVTMAMDVHEHFPSHKERVFVDSRVLPFCHTWQVENPLP
jgi:hypothetical protein